MSEAFMPGAFYVPFGSSLLNNPNFLSKDHNESFVSVAGIEFRKQSSLSS